MDEFFTLLKVNLFFKDNTLLKLSYQAETIDQLLGLTYHVIHACYNSCIFKFKRGLSKAKACPKCQRSRFLKGPTFFLASCSTIFPWSHDWSIYKVFILGKTKCHMAQYKQNQRWVDLLFMIGRHGSILTTLGLIL